MKKLTTTLCLIFALLFGGVGLSYALPPCAGYWHNCVGSQAFASGNRYIGEYRNGEPNGQGTFFFGKSGSEYVGEFKNDKRNGPGILYAADGTVKKEGIWRDNKFQYAQKSTPPVIAKPQGNEASKTAIAKGENLLAERRKGVEAVKHSWVVKRCDNYAAHPFDPKKTGEGVVWGELPTKNAINACERVLKLFPEHPRFLFQLGRALHKDGDRASAIQFYRKSVGQKYVPAMFNLAMLTLELNKRGTSFTSKYSVRLKASEGMDLLEKAAQLGYWPAQNGLMRIHLRSSDRYEEVLYWARKGSKNTTSNILGPLRSKLQLAKFYWQGRALEQSLPQARYLYQEIVKTAEEFTKGKRPHLSMRRKTRVYNLAKNAQSFLAQVEAQMRREGFPLYANKFNKGTKTPKPEVPNKPDQIDGAELKGFPKLPFAMAKREADEAAERKLKAKREADEAAERKLKAKREADEAAERKLKAKREADEAAERKLKAKREADEAAERKLKAKREADEAAERKLKAKREADEAAERKLKAKREADEAKRHAIAEEEKKTREADWVEKGIPINELRRLDKKTKTFKNLFVIVIGSSDILELFPEKDYGGVVTGLKVLAGCRYYNPIIINRTRGKAHVSAFKLVSNKVSLFGNVGSRAGISIKNSPLPGRYFNKIGNSVRLAAKVQHYRIKNGHVRDSLSESDRRFFVRNYGCAEQVHGLKMVYKPEDLNTDDASMKNRMKPKNLVVLIDSENTQSELSRIKVETE